MAEKTVCGVVHTINNTVEMLETDPFDGLKGVFKGLNYFLTRFLGNPEVCNCYNTYQFPDYDMYYVPKWDQEEKRQWRDFRFPKDLEGGFQAGIRLAQRIKPA